MKKAKIFSVLPVVHERMFPGWSWQTTGIGGIRRKVRQGMTVGLDEASGSPWQPSLRCLQHGEKGKDVISGVG